MFKVLFKYRCFQHNLLEASNLLIAVTADNASFFEILFPG